MTEISSTAAKVIYEDASASRASLDEVLKQYRSNAIVLISLGTAVASFSGFSEIERTGLFLLALAAYVAAVAVAAWQFWPTTWKQCPGFGGSDFVANQSGVDDTTYFLLLAKEHEAAYEHNSRRLATGFGYAQRMSLLIVMLAIMTTLMIAAIAQTPNDAMETSDGVEHTDK